MIKRKSRNRQSNPTATRNPAANPTYYQPPQTRAPAAGDAPAVQQQPQQPIVTHNRAVANNQQAATTTGSLQVALVNQSNSNQVYAYISALELPSESVVTTLTILQLAKPSTTTTRFSSYHRTQRLLTTHPVPLQQAPLSAPTLP